MKQSGLVNPGDKLSAVMMIGLSLVVGVPDVILAYITYTAIESHGLLAFAGLLVTGTIAVLCAGSLIQYSGELTRNEIRD